MRRRQKRRKRHKGEEETQKGRRRQRGRRRQKLYSATLCSVLAVCTTVFDGFYWLLFQPESRDGEEEEDPQQVEEEMTQEHLIQRPF